MNVLSRFVITEHVLHSLLPAGHAVNKLGYEDLCGDESLCQVLNGGTTNPNESFHEILWPLCSKNKYYTRK